VGRIWGRGEGRREGCKRRDKRTSPRASSGHPAAFCPSKHPHRRVGGGVHFRGRRRPRGTGRAGGTHRARSPQRATPAAPQRRFDTQPRRAHVKLVALRQAGRTVAVVAPTAHVRPDSSRDALQQAGPSPGQTWAPARTRIKTAGGGGGGGRGARRARRRAPGARGGVGGVAHGGWADRGRGEGETEGTGTTPRGFLPPRRHAAASTTGAASAPAAAAASASRATTRAATRLPCGVPRRAGK